LAAVRITRSFTLLGRRCLWNVKDEQTQVNNLLQAIHGFVENQSQQIAYQQTGSEPRC